MLNECITAAVLSVPALLVIEYFKRRSQQVMKRMQASVDAGDYKFMFVTHKNRLCHPHLNARMVCGSNCSFLYLKNILNMINQASESLSVCMYHITIEDVHHALINAHFRGVRVRLITDFVMANNITSKTRGLIERGIPVKVQSNKIGLMHHKFLLIDEKQPHGKVIYGSLNYTLNALINNWEYAMLTSDTSIVGSFSKGFEHMWEHKEFTYFQ